MMGIFRKHRILRQNLTPQKVRNLYELWASFYRSKQSGHSLHRGMPFKLGFEPTTHCNLRCPECPSGLRSFTRPTGMAQMDLFRKVVDELHPDLVYLLLYFQGEPYLNPDFLDMAAYATGKGIFTATSTNAHYLTDEKARLTVESGISEVIISLDGVTQEAYESYRVGGKLEKVLDGIQRLVSWRQKLRSLTPHIVIQFLVVRPNEAQIPEVLALGKKLGVDKVALKTAQIYDFEQGSELIPTQDRYSRYAKGPDGLYHIKNSLENQCWKLWQGAEITWDGKVLPCCFDKDAQYVMGDLHTTSFRDIWHSAPYDAFRNQLLGGRQQIEMCRNCSEGTKVFA